MDTREVGTKLVEHCKAGNNMKAVEELYGKDIVTVEPMSMPDMPAEQHGLDAVRKKHEWWNNNHEIHSANAEGPFVHGERFAVVFDYDITATGGPQAGQRNRFKEVGLYTVKDGKIVREEFFY